MMTRAQDMETMLMTRVKSMLRPSVWSWATISAMTTYMVMIMFGWLSWSRSEQRGTCKTKGQSDGTGGGGDGR